MWKNLENKGEIEKAAVLRAGKVKTFGTIIVPAGPRK
jgi:hypothetical protein